MLFVVRNKKVFTPNPSTGRVRVTAEDLNEISDFTLEASPLLVDTLPAWFRVRIDSTAFKAVATTENIALFSLPASGLVHAVAIVPRVAFSGGGVTAYTLSVGITGTLAKYAAAFNVFQAPGATVFQLTTTQGMESVTALTSLRVAATSTTANLSAVTVGSCDVYLLMSRLPLPA